MPSAPAAQQPPPRRHRTDKEKCWSPVIGWKGGDGVEEVGASAAHIARHRDDTAQARHIAEPPPTPITHRRAQRSAGRCALSPPPPLVYRRGGALFVSCEGRVVPSMPPLHRHAGPRRITVPLAVLLPPPTMPRQGKRPTSSSAAVATRRRDARCRPPCVCACACVCRASAVRVVVAEGRAAL